MYSLFVILGAIISSPKVAFHSDLVPKGTQRQDTRGGGFYFHDVAKNEITFFSKSIVYGPAEIRDLRECVKNGKHTNLWNNCKFYYIHYSFRPEAYGDCSAILDKRVEL